MGSINTNMASEFWFFSQLHRLGYQAYITLGNTKAIDITVQLSDKSLLTFDVKGKESFNSGTYQYLPKIKKDNHYFVFIGLQIRKENGRIRFDSEPDCYIINSQNLDSIAADWISSLRTTQGYGLEPKLLRIITKHTNEKDLSKSEGKKLARFKESRRIDKFNFNHFKEKILTLDDFEELFYDRK